MKLFKLLFALTLMLMIYASPASAEYSYQMVVPPGALGFTQLFGVNEDGIVTGEAYDGAFFSFTYDMESGEYTTISYELGVLEISNSGVMVGDVNGVCAIRDKKGNITNFFPPSSPDYSICQARGVNSKGKVSGFLREGFDDWLGFIYDPKKDTYEEFLPSRQTFAVGINGPGQNVGSVTLDDDEAYTGSPAGRYGYLRQKDGSVKYFVISQSIPGWTRARGISETGLISGFYLDADSFEIKGYVTTLSNGTEFETITLTDDQIVHQKPCYPNNPPPPFPGYELFTDMTAQQIRTDGVVVGSCTDYQFNETTGHAIFGSTHGFIATPIE